MTDYEKIGFKAGLEIHQQLDTHKLFCKCESVIIDDTDYSFTRQLRPTQSEMGDVDIAALTEAKREKKFLYRASDKASCMVEADEEPPHSANEEAIDTTLTIALLLGSRIVDEIHFMRKIVIDGSNTTGFQRTALISIGGEIDGIGIETICLEEDAARKMGEGEFVEYGLGRLGIPLIEIATKPDIKNPEQVKKIAAKIGGLLRATKVKRGIGTIRQDLNVSIAGGARVEIKGVQELNQIPIIAENEAKRQLEMIKLKEKLKGRKADFKIAEVADIIDAKLALKLPDFLIDQLRRGFDARAKIEGGKIVYSDELKKISSPQAKKIKERIRCKNDDDFILCANERILKSVMERAGKAFEGVQREVRKALPDGSTEYMRPMPGAARLYPETDVPPIPITKKRIGRIRKNLPELPEKKIERFVSYGISEEQTRQIVSSKNESRFEFFAEKYPAGIVARIFLNVLPEMEEKGMAVNDETIEEILYALNKGKFAKEALPKLLRYCSKNPDTSIDEAIKECGIEALGKERVREIVEEIVEERRDFIMKRGKNALGPLMGIAMKKLRGRTDGETVSEVLKKEIEEILMKK